MILIALSSNAWGFLLLVRMSERERREGVQENPSSGLNIAGSNPARATNYRLSLNRLGFFITSRDQLLTK